MPFTHKVIVLPMGVNQFWWWTETWRTIGMCVQHKRPDMLNSVAFQGKSKRAVPTHHSWSLGTVQHTHQLRLSPTQHLLMVNLHLCQHQGLPYKIKMFSLLTYLAKEKLEILPGKIYYNLTLNHFHKAAPIHWDTCVFRLWELEKLLQQLHGKWAHRYQNSSLTNLNVEFSVISLMKPLQVVVKLHTLSSKPVSSQSKGQS